MSEDYANGAAYDEAAHRAALRGREQALLVLEEAWGRGSDRSQLRLLEVYASISTSSWRFSPPPSGRSHSAASVDTSRSWTHQ